MKFETHLHTADSNDPFATISGGELARLYKEQGYGGIVITDHFFEETRDWLSRDSDVTDHEQFMNRWLKGYREAKKVGNEIGLLVFLGMELRFDGSINDYLIYGMDEAFLKNNPPLNTLDLATLNKIKTPSMLIYQAHPFRDNMTICNPEHLFGIEVYNASTDLERNHIAEEWANLYNLHRLSGSDCHQPYQIAGGGIDTFDTITQYGDFLSALKNDSYSLLKNNKEA